VLDLLGPHAWYFPGWLDRRLPRLAIEREAPAPALPRPPRPALEDA
jgi:hypothetical protein